MLEKNPAMSDGAATGFSEKEEFRFLSSQSDLRKSSFRKHSLWMAHWRRASSSAERESSSPFEEIFHVGHSKDCGSLPFELSKARMAERLMLGVSNTGASAVNTEQFSSKIWGVTHNVCQGVECKNVNPVNRSCDNTMMHKNVNLYAADTVVSERFSIHKISDISMNSCKVLSSKNLSLDWNHFPMFEINRKIDSILNPRRYPFNSPDKSFVSQRALQVNMSTSNVMTSSSKEYEFHSHHVTGKNNSKGKSGRHILSDKDNLIGLNSDHVKRKLKGHSFEESCSCSKSENNSSGSLREKGSASNFVVNHEGSPLCSSENKFMFSASASRKDNELVQGTPRGKRLVASGGFQEQSDFGRVTSHQLVLGNEYDMKSVHPSGRSEGNYVKTSHHGVTSTNLLLCKRDNLTLDKVDSAMKLTESYKLPDTAENAVAVMSKDETQAGGKPPNDKLTNHKKAAPYLFEMLTVPSKLQATCFEDPISLDRFCGDMGSLSGESGAQKQFPTTSNILNLRHAPGFAGTSTQKDSGWPNMEQISTSSIRRVSSCSGGNETFNLNEENHNSFPKATCASKQEWSRSKASSMNLDLVLYKINRMRNSISSALTESPVCSEPSNKWLKRLQHDVSDPHFLCSKRSKFEDDPAPGGTCAVSGQELDCDIGKAVMINHVMEGQPGYGRLTNQQNREASPISSNCLNRWIGRWCQGGIPLFHATSNVEKQTAKSSMPPDNLEGQFPSIAALAMMGRVMNKLRPRELQRRGPSVVWKTQGL